MSARPGTDHPFVTKPHRTLAALSFPVLLSLVAEPLTGLVDTAFVARLGAAELAALGVGTTVLSSLFWIFNFLSIGTQTEVAQASGARAHVRERQIAGLALAMSGVLGVLLIVLGWPTSPLLATAMGAAGELHIHAVAYMEVRWFGAPAVLATIAAFGALRGLQDMRTPLWIAVTVNVLNIVLDAVLIFGLGPIPPMGVAGAALASVVSQWIGAAWAVAAVIVRLGWPQRLRAEDVTGLLRIGGDLFVRTGLLTLFLVLSTRAATRLGADAGAAHQAIRQVWMFTALFLDAFAITGQSLVGYFVGSGWWDHARRVARVVCLWSLATGVLLGLLMVLGTPLVVRFLLPATAVAALNPAWYIAAAVQPVNALSFATDGLHWGTGDFRYLRNAMILATGVGAVLLFMLDETNPEGLTWIWVVMCVWITIRAVTGVVRIWPGVGQSPLRRCATPPPAVMSSGGAA